MLEMGRMERPSSASSVKAPWCAVSSAPCRASAVGASTSTESAWPPMNATSMRTRSSTIRNQLHQHPMDRIRMDEGDLHPVQAGLRLRVDQLRALGVELGQRTGEIGDVVRDVVHAGASLRQELPHRRFVSQRGEQLDPALSDEHGGGLDSLSLHRLPLLEAGPEQALVGLDGLVQVLDRNAEMVDSARLHRV